MGKRIRWIWVISLAAALAAIGVQGYWLFNQFRYEMCTYADEIAGEVFHAGQEEFRIRKEEAEMTKGTYIIERQSKYQSGDSVLNGLKNSFGFQLYPKDTTKIHSFRLHLDPNMPEDWLGQIVRSWSSLCLSLRSVWTPSCLPVCPVWIIGYVRS